MKNILSYLLIFYPLQVLALPIATSKFDIFPIILLFVLSLEVVIKKKINRISKSNLIYILFFCSVSIVIFIIFRYATLSRFVSGIFWLTGLLYVNFTASSLYSKKFYNMMTLLGVVVVLCILFQYFFLNHPRPKAFFIEPSTAGLVLYSLALMMGYRYLLKRGRGNIKKEFFLFFLFAISGFLTQSSHLFLLIIVPAILLIYAIDKRTLSKIIVIAPPFFLLLLYVITNNEYFINKFDFSQVDNFNLSQLAWVRGLEQALFVLSHSPIFGFGLGATGCFNYDSEYIFYLEKLGGADLNLLDAYSLMFRWIIEIGMGTLILIIYLLHRRVKILINDRDLSESSLNIKSLFVFGFSIIIGSLIKEPNYGVSPLFLSIICMSFLCILKKNNYVTSKTLIDKHDLSDS